MGVWWSQNTHKPCAIGKLRMWILWQIVCELEGLSQTMFTFWMSPLIRDHTWLFVFDCWKYRKITNGDFQSMPCVIAYHPLINIGRKYSSNIKYIIIVHLVHHMSYIHLWERRKIENRREHLAILGYITISVTVMYLARINRKIFHLSLSHHHLLPRLSYNTAAWQWTLMTKDFSFILKSSSMHIICRWPHSICDTTSPKDRCHSF
jgi:hypothetical protein